MWAGRPGKRKAEWHLGGARTAIGGTPHFPDCTVKVGHLEPLPRIHHSSGAFSQARWSTRLERGRQPISRS